MKSKFTYDFIVWILKKFVGVSLLDFAKNAGWEKNTIYGWKTRGLPTALLALLEEKLINLKIMGKISFQQSINLCDLFNEYTEVDK